MRHPSIVIGEGRVQAMVIGSGWGPSADARGKVEASIRSGVPLVVDAEALGVLDGLELPADSLLTPHAGELARMLDIERAQVEAEPATSAREAAGRFGATVLLKGATQYVATPEGDLIVAHRGPAWTAQAGSGDVLAGVCGVLLAAGLPAGTAGALGASLQALAAERFPGPYPPDRLAATFPEVLGSLSTSM